MELTFPYFISLLLLVLSLSISALCFFITRRGSSDQKLPPGKTGWPVIGESIEFLSMCWKGNPEKFVMDRMRQFSNKVFRTSLFAQNMAVFCGAEGHKFLFTNEGKLVISWWPDSVNKVFPSSLQTSSKEESKKLRGLLPGFLKPEALQKYVSIMDAMAKNHLETDWLPNKEIKVFPLSKKYTFALACRLFMSIDDPNHVAKFSGPFVNITAGIISVPIDLPGTPFNRAIKGANFIRKELMAIMKQRKIDLAEKRATPNQDILSHMLLATDSNGKFLNELDIADKILGLLIGGHETASAAITFIVKYLGQYPKVYDAVYKEQMEIAASKKPGELLNWDDMQKMKYSWCVASEVMRLAPPVLGAFREALTDISYSGFTIPKGWKTYWNLQSTHRNPVYFPNPDTFDPSRFEGSGPAPYTFTPFGGGPRMCPGKEYARLEILCFMHNVVRMFKWETLIPDEKIIFNPGAVPVKDVPVRLYPRET